MMEEVGIPAGGLTLRGALHMPSEPPRGGVVVCHPYPLAGGHMDLPIMIDLAQRLSAVGLLALRFNTRGVGGSQGVVGIGKHEVLDVLSAVDFLVDRLADRPVGLVGYSFGAALSLIAASRDERVAAVAALSPIARRVSPQARTAIRCQVLLGVGDLDEVADPDDVRALAEAIGRRARVEVFPGVDHQIGPDDLAVLEALVEFCAETIPARAS
jgi:alpha/beta superfamily hydrolase